MSLISLISVVIFSFRNWIPLWTTRLAAILRSPLLSCPVLFLVPGSVRWHLVFCVCAASLPCVSKYTSRKAAFKWSGILFLNVLVLLILLWPYAISATFGCAAPVCPGLAWTRNASSRSKDFSSIANFDTNGHCTLVWQPIKIDLKGSGQTEAKDRKKGSKKERKDYRSVSLVEFVRIAKEGNIAERSWSRKRERQKSEREKEIGQER